MKKKTHKIYDYTAVFEPDLESGGYVVTIPALPGCISQGETFEEAKAMIEDAASLFIEFMAEEKQEIPVESEKIFTAPVRVTA